MANNEINKIRVRRGLSADLKQLDEAEPGFAIDAGKLYVGTENGKNVCINPDPDSSLDETSKNYVENAVVAKAVNAVKKRVSDIEEIVLTEYGIRWPHGASSPDCERVTRQDGVMKVGTDTGLSFTVEEDGTFNSSFDNIYPWSEMQRVTLAGQVMVAIPKYYILFETVGGYDYIWVCKEKLQGYRCAATHLDTSGIEKDFYYVGAYETVAGHLGESQAGYEYPTTGATITNHRNAAKALGDGWGITTIAEVCDFWQIILPIEFATRDVQSVAQGMTWSSSGPFPGMYEGLEYSTGMCDDVANKNGIKVVTTTNPDYDATQEEYSHLTGVNCGMNPFIYRGIENPYGCLAKWVDGLTLYNGECYTTNDRTAFATSSVEGYTKLGYQPAATGTVKELGYDEDTPYCRLAIETEDTTDVYYCDRWYLATATSGYRVCRFGGSYNSKQDAGVWYLSLNYYVTFSIRNTGSRLSYSPV